MIDTEPCAAGIPHKIRHSEIYSASSAGGCSVPLFFEYEDVLSRAELLLEIGTSRAQIDAFLTDVAGVIDPVQLDFLWRPQLRDAADEMVVETAANSSADFLVTLNVSDFRAIKGRFNFEVVTPGDFLRRYKS